MDSHFDHFFFNQVILFSQALSIVLKQEWARVSIFLANDFGLPPCQIKEAPVQTAESKLKRLSAPLQDERAGQPWHGRWTVQLKGSRERSPRSATSCACSSCVVRTRSTGPQCATPRSPPTPTGRRPGRSACCVLLLCAVGELKHHLNKVVFVHQEVLRLVSLLNDMPTPSDVELSN